MAKEMLINVSAGEECRIALLENNKLEELYMERTSNTSHVGNIYKGKVTNVEPSIQAAFVDFGIGRNGFLHISDLMPSYFGGKKSDRGPAEKVGQKLGRRDRPPIQQCLRKGDEIVVQIIKEGIGTKGPTLSTYLSVPGRVLVMMPGMAKMGVSKKIEDETERHRLRKILDGLVPPKDCGFIIRTAGIGKTKLEIEKDLKYLARLWDQLKKQIDKDKPPVELYTEGDLITRTVRDVFTTDVDRIIVDDKETAKKIKDFIKLAMPRTKNKVELYEDVVPLFHKFELEEVVESMYSRRVPLPSGGSLIIDQTEAVVAIDVNSGKFRDHSDAETTAFKTDMEAADEIPRQLRLRDMGGVIICDFIDLRFERHRRELEERLFENLKGDRAKTRMLRMSQFGIIEMTRQRMRPSLRKAIYHDCHACAGQGMVKTPESMALDVMRKLRIALNDGAVVRALLTVHPEVAMYLQNRKRYELAKLEQVAEKSIAIAADADMATDETKFELYDSRDGYIYIAELGMALPSHQPHRREPHAEPRGRRDAPRRDDRRPQAAKAKHDVRDDDAVDSEELFGEEGEQTKALPPAEAKPAGRGRGRAAKAVEAEVDEDAIEQTGNDDEASTVEVDEGGDALPGHAPDGFFERGADDRGRGRDQNRGRDRGRGRNDRGRNNDRRPDNNRGPDNRGPAASPPPAVKRPRDEDEEADDDTEITDDPSAEGQVEGNEGQFEGTGDERNEAADRGPDNNGPVGPNGEQLPREGGRRRRRRRGRRGRGGRTEGEGENAPQGERPEGEAPAEGDAPQGDDAQTDQPPRNEPRRDEPRRDQPRNDGRRDQPRRDQPRQDDPRRIQPQGDRNRPQQGGRRQDSRQDSRRGPQQGGDSRRGSSRADLSHLAREAARQDAGNHDGVDPVEDEHATPGNDINFVPKPREEPAGRGGRGQRGGRRPGRGPARGAVKRQPPLEGLPNDDELDAEAAALEAQLAKARETEMTPPGTAISIPGPIVVPDIEPTGSTDSHLVDDEPADGEEVRPPSSYTDLDALPDYEDD